MQTLINHKKAIWNVFIVSFGILLIDQIIKIALINGMIIHPTFQNYNALFGIPFDNSLAFFFLATILFYTVYQRKTLLESYDDTAIIYIGFILGGVMGNSADRITRGFVVDYLTFADFFSFNISDLAIVTGSLLLFLKIIKK